MRGAFEFPSVQPAEQALLCHAALWSLQQASGSVHCFAGQPGHSGTITMANSADAEPRWTENGKETHEGKQKAQGSNMEKCGLLVNDGAQLAA